MRRISQHLIAVAILCVAALFPGWAARLMGVGGGAVLGVMATSLEVVEPPAVSA